MIAHRCLVAAASLLWLAVSAATSSAQGQVWVVDDGGGPGVDFTALQPAVNAASDGDLILVKDGLYGGFAIDGKTLSVIADLGSNPTVFNAVAVRNLTAAQSVAVRGLTHYAFAGGYLVLQANTGPVWIEDSDWASSQDSLPAASATDSSPVAFLRCTFDTVPMLVVSIPNAPGLRAVRSVVSVFDSMSAGGEGSSSHGAYVEDAFVYASGSSFQGGHGTPCTGLIGSCSGGTGANGLIALSGGNVVSLECAFAGGPGGAGPPSGCVVCNPGPSGAPVTLAGGTHGTLAEASRSFEATSPIRAGQSATLTATGNPGDFVVALYAVEQSHTFLPNAGTLLLPLDIGTKTGFALLGVTDATGTLQSQVPFAPFPLGFDFLQVYLQGVFITPQPVIIFGGGSLLVVLNQAF